MRWRLGSLALVAMLAGSMIPGPDAIATTEEELDQAIRRGVEYLQSAQEPDGTFRGDLGKRVGAVALAGLALLECGQPADSLAVSGATEYVLERAQVENQTYDLALAIMFFDRLTRSQETATLRAVRGQPRSGHKTLPSGRILAGGQVGLSSQILEWGARLKHGQGPRGCWTYSCTRPADGDHSNTQFGVLGLWVAGLHGVDVTENLQRSARHFRSSQSTAGGWGYRGSGATPAMTCAGLIALATDLGAESESQSGPQRPRVVARRQADEHVEAALGFLGGVLKGDPSGDLYFLWSLERVGVLFGWDQIGQTEWYPWGADALIRLQQRDGSWTYRDQSVGTSFALLFLSRSNVSPELTTALTGRFGSGTSGTQSLRARLPDVIPTQAFLESEADQLLTELSIAGPSRQREILEALRDGKGVVYTDALSAAIGRLSGSPLQEDARQCLVERMQRMTVKTLRSKLAGEENRVRIAAAEAAALREATELVPELVDLLFDPEPSVWQAAHRSLCRLTGEDFGPRAGAGAVECFQASRAWRQWWESNDRAQPHG